jgi:hypothetical protein
MQDIFASNRGIKRSCLASYVQYLTEITCYLISLLAVPVPFIKLFNTLRVPFRLVFIIFK